MNKLTFVCSNGQPHEFKYDVAGQYCSKCCKLTDDLVNEYTAKQVEAALKNAPSSTSDGYHTFKELYYHRMLLQASWFNMLYKEAVDLDAQYGTVVPVKSWRHHDGRPCFGKENYFVVVAQLPTGQISNHYKGEYWDLFQIPEWECAPEWDGHTPQQAAERILASLTHTEEKPE